MDRRAFLKSLWNKLVKPLLILGVLIFSINFLIDVFKEISNERMILIIIIGFIILSIIIYFVNLYLKKIIDLLFPIALGAFIYLIWQTDNMVSIGFFGIYLIIKISDIIKKEKLSYIKSDT